MPQQARAARVAQLISEDQKRQHQHQRNNDDHQHDPVEESADKNIQSKEVERISIDPEHSIISPGRYFYGAFEPYGEVWIEVLPAVAIFESYRNEKESEPIRYLSSVNYFGPEADLAKPLSLLTFFDEEKASLPGTTEQGNNAVNTVSGSPTEVDVNGPLFTGISAVAIGPGLDEADDVAEIKSFFQTMCHHNPNNKDPINIEVIQPNPEFKNMKEELLAFRELSLEEKEAATAQRKLGPGKMAKFVVDLAKRVVDEKIYYISGLTQQISNAQILPQDEKPENNSGPDQQSDTAKQKLTIAKSIDPNQTRFCCRKCRTILFGGNDLEDPPHVQSRHGFSARKVNHAGGYNNSSSSSSLCQSYFLRQHDGEGSGFPWWMGDQILSTVEGKFTCPKCETKLGTWQWSGSQCSCGTWVVPAIQIPKSKVDEISSWDDMKKLPSGTVVSPFCVPHPLGPTQTT